MAKYPVDSNSTFPQDYEVNLFNFAVVMHNNISTMVL